MKRNYTITSNTPIVEYEVSSKGIRHIRTTLPGKKSKDDSKQAGADNKRDKKD